MTPEDIGSVVVAAAPAVSPDGHLVAFVVRRTDAEANKYRSQLWLAHTDGSIPARPLTHGGSKDSGPAWSPTGDRLAFISDRTDAKGATTIHVMPMSGPGETYLVATLPDSAHTLRWSPDGTRLAFVARTPDERYKETDDAKQPPRRIERFYSTLNGEGWVYDRPEHVYVVAADGSEPPVNVTPGEHAFGRPVWIDDARLATSGAIHDDYDVDLSKDLFVVDLSTEPGTDHANLRALTARSGAYDAHAMSAGMLVFSGIDNAHEYPQNSKVGVVDVESGDRRWLATGFDRTCETTAGGSSIHVDDDGGILSLFEDRGDTRVYAVSDVGAIPTSPAESVVHAYSHAGGITAVAMSTITRTAELFVYTAANAEPRRLTALADRFVRAASPLPAERFVAVSTGGVEVDAWLLRPAGFDPSRRYPVLVNVHGGPFTQYGNSFFDEAQMQATAGFVVVMGNPRGGSGRETAWGQAIMGPKHPTAPGSGWGTVDVEDVMAILDEALRRFTFCDPDRVGMLGGSYGGFMATTLAVRHGNRFKAICSERAVNNLLSEEWNSDIATMFRIEHGVDHVTDPEEYLRMSPSRQVAEIRTPMLLIHSEDDLRCPITQAEELFVALRMLGRDVEFHRFPAETHELSRSGSPVHRRQRAQIILDFFGRHLSAKE